MMSGNLSGAMIEQTYPSGRKVKNVIDNDGQLSMVQSKKNANTGYFNYSKNFTFNATGAVESMQLGNGKWESTTFNSRLQPTQIALGTVQSGTDKLKLNFDYGSTNNNGNVLSQIIKVPDTVNATGFTAIQTYNYDELNRLKSAEEKIANVTSWKQTYTFDRYGNRRFDEANTDTLQGGCATAVCNPTIDPATNKLVGYTFDNAGNTKVDATGQTFTYDAENKQILVKDSSSNTVGEYFYDGDGKRIKKIASAEETIFVYNASGQLVAEYTNQTPQNTPRVSYLTSDHLGSPRITTDMDGDVFSRRDFMPFGEELDSTHTSQRSVNLNYGEDGIKQKFTSYERDNETDLDFAQARMYANKLGRFTTVDPILIEKNRLRDPQAINLYVYTRNNPLIYIDPDGRMYVDEDGNVITVDKNWEVSCKKCKKGSKQLKSLQKLAALVKNSRSKSAMEKFMALNDSKGKVHILIGKGFSHVNGGRHQPYGKLYDENGEPDKKGVLDWSYGDKDDGSENGFDGVATTVDGEDVYEEAIITIDLDDLQNTFENFKKAWNAPNVTFDEYIVLTFNHEAKHNLDPEQVRNAKNGVKGANWEKNSGENTELFLKEIKEIKASPK